MRLHPKSAKIGGSVEVDGRDVLKLSPAELAAFRGRTVSMIFQDPGLAFDPVYRVGDQIAEAVKRHDGSSMSEGRKRALELFERVRIPSPERRLDNYPHEMSGGMRQRAMIALALACRPKVLLADEPTTALDATVQIQVLLLLRELQRELGLGVIFVTHDIGVAVEVADRIAVMYGGRIVEMGSCATVIRSPAHPYTQGLLASRAGHSVAKGSRLVAIPGAPPDLANLPPGCAFAPRCNIAARRMSSGHSRTRYAGAGALRLLPTADDRGSQPNLQSRSEQPAHGVAEAFDFALRQRGMATGHCLRPSQTNQGLCQHDTSRYAVDHGHRNGGLHAVDKPGECSPGNDDAFGVILLDEIVRELRRGCDHVGRVGEILRPHVERPVAGDPSAQSGACHDITVHIQNAPHRPDEADRAAEHRRGVQGSFGHSDDREGRRFPRGVERGVERYRDDRGVARTRMLGQQFNDGRGRERILGPRADDLRAAACRDRHDLGARHGCRASCRGASVRDGLGGVGVEQKDSHSISLVLRIRFPERAPPVRSKNIPCS